MHPRSGRASLLRRVWNSLGPTLRFWMQTEVHVHCFSIAANVLLSFFPFLIVSVSLGSLVFEPDTVKHALDTALRDFFPGAMSNFLYNNLPAKPRHFELLSILILLFSANGVFEPLEVGLNHIWGIGKNRSFLRNQAISLAMIFATGSLALMSLAVAAIQPATDFIVERWVISAFYKAAAVPLTVLGLLIIYRYLPNGRPPVQRVLPAAIGVGVLLEIFKTINIWIWPAFDTKLQREYGVFRYSATLIFFSFLVSMLVLGGAEWAARGHKLLPKEPQK
jgi:membrane protein